MTVAETGSAERTPPFVKLIRQGRLLAVHARNLAATPVYAVPSFGVGDAFIAAVQLMPVEAEMWRNGRSSGRLRLPEGGLQLFDLRHLWRAAIHPPYETVNLRVPLELLSEAAGTDIHGLVFDPPPVMATRTDPIMLSLARALVPAFSSSSEISAQFAEQVLRAAATHLVGAYGVAGLNPTLDRPNAGLALWQQRRATHILMQHIDRDVPMTELADSCGLSVGHFSRAFRTSFGLPPHRWLLRERVRRAADLMSSTELPIDQIAVTCGFVDQSHLSRVFRRVMDMPPAAWRRARRSEGSAVAG